MTTQHYRLEPETAAGSERTESTDSTDSKDILAIAENVAALSRWFVRSRAQAIANATPEYAVKWWAQLLLQHLATEGPMRSSALAELVQSDPSTVSRQVASLVKDGLVERRADPDDGRATLLVLTPKGTAVAAQHSAARLEWFAGVVDDWSPDELRQFAASLTRFVSQFSAAGAAWLAGVPKESHP